MIKCVNSLHEIGIGNLPVRRRQQGHLLLQRS